MFCANETRPIFSVFILHTSISQRSVIIIKHHKHNCYSVTGTYTFSVLCSLSFSEINILWKFTIGFRQYANDFRHNYLDLLFVITNAKVVVYCFSFRCSVLLYIMARLSVRRRSNAFHVVYVYIYYISTSISLLSNVVIIPSWDNVYIYIIIIIIITHINVFLSC